MLSKLQIEKLMTKPVILNGKIVGIIVEKQKLIEAVRPFVERVTEV